MEMPKRMIGVAICLLAAAFGAGAHGDTIVSLHDVQPVDGGLWQYNYWIDNSDGSDAVMTFCLANIDDATVFASPEGWGNALIEDPGLGGWAMWNADPGAELSPGFILSGFVIQSPYSSGTGTALAYAYDMDYDYNGFPVSIDGPASSSPEPAPLLLFGSGAVPLVFRRLKHRR